MRISRQFMILGKSLERGFMLGIILTRGVLLVIPTIG